MRSLLPCNNSSQPPALALNSRIPPQLEKCHVVPPSSQDEALAPYSVSREVLQTAQSSAPSLLGAQEERAALCTAGHPAVSLPSTRITIRCQGHHHQETMTIKRCPDMTRCPSESILKIPISSHQPEHPWDTTRFCLLFPPARSFHLSE